MLYKVVYMNNNDSECLEAGKSGADGAKKLTSLRGYFQHRLAENHRIHLPATFKEALLNRGVNRLVIIQEPECLVVYPEDEWQKKEEEFKKLNLDNKKVRMYLRKLYSTLEDVELDVAGRFVLSDKFIKAMKLGNQVVLLGLINFFEIWHPDRYRWKQEDWEQEFDGNREFVSGLLEKRELDEEEG